MAQELGVVRAEGDEKELEEQGGGGAGAGGGATTSFHMLKATHFNELGDGEKERDGERWKMNGTGTWSGQSSG